jgi:hypothetical protein
MPRANSTALPGPGIRRRYRGKEKVSDLNRHSMRLGRKVTLLPAFATLLYKDPTLAGATLPGIIAPTMIDFLLKETFTFDAKQVARLAFRTSHVTHLTTAPVLCNSSAKHFIRF